LGYQVYQRNSISVINPEAIESLEIILNKKNIACDFKLNNIEVKKYMKKINISNEKNIEEKFISISEIAGNNVEYTGRSKEIIGLPAIIAGFIRETQLSDIKIQKISLGYYPEISLIDNNVISGEATPAWSIILDTGEEFIYNAYLGDKMNMEKK
jgi:hypothetical protein